MGSIQSYTKAALDALLNGKSDLSHTHAAGLAMSGFTRAVAGNATFLASQVGFADYTFDKGWNATGPLAANAPTLLALNNGTSNSHVFGAEVAGFYVAKYAMAFQISSASVPPVIEGRMNFGSTDPGSTNPLTQFDLRPGKDGKTFQLDKWTGPFWVPGVGATNTGAFGIDASWNTLGAIPSIAWWSVQIDVAKLG